MGKELVVGLLPKTLPGVDGSGAVEVVPKGFRSGTEGDPLLPKMLVSERDGSPDVAGISEAGETISDI